MSSNSEKPVLLFPTDIYEDDEENFDPLFVKLCAQLKIPIEEPKFINRTIYTIPEENNIDNEITIPEKI
jgi:hypothetical protein